VTACRLLQLSRNTSHTQYMCTVDMTALLADFKVQVDVTEIADRQHVISKGFYMADNSKYKNGGFDKYCLTVCLSAGIVWARSEHGSWWWRAYVWCPLAYTEHCALIVAVVNYRNTYA